MTSIIGTVQVVLYCVDDGSEDEMQGRVGTHMFTRVHGEGKKEKYLGKRST